MRERTRRAERRPSNGKTSSRPFNASSCGPTRRSGLLVLAASDGQGIGQSTVRGGFRDQVVGVGVRLDCGRRVGDGLLVASRRVQLPRQGELDVGDLVLLGGPLQGSGQVVGGLARRGERGRPVSGPAQLLDGQPRQLGDVRVLRHRVDGVEVVLGDTGAMAPAPSSASPR